MTTYTPLTSADNRLTQDTVPGDVAVSVTSDKSSWSCKNVLKQLEGKILLFLAGFISVNVYSFGKHASHIPVGQFSAMVFGTALIFQIPALIFLEEKVDFHGKFWYVAARAFTGALSGIFKYWAASFMDYGNSMAIMAMVPSFAALFSRILWKEKLSVFTIVGLFIGLSGVTLVAKPPFIFGDTSQSAQYDPILNLVPIVSAILLGFAFSCMRRVGSLVNPVLVSSMVSVCVVVEGVVFHLVNGHEWAIPGCHKDRAVVFSGGLGIFLVLILLNRGLVLEKSGPGLLIRNLDVVTAYGIQILFFGAIPEVLTIVGAVLIISSAVLVTLNKLFFEKHCKLEF